MLSNLAKCDLKGWTVYNERWRTIITRKWNNNGIRQIKKICWVNWYKWWHFFSRRVLQWCKIQISKLSTNSKNNFDKKLSHTWLIIITFFDWNIIKNCQIIRLKWKKNLIGNWQNIKADYVAVNVDPADLKIQFFTEWQWLIKRVVADV